MALLTAAPAWSQRTVGSVDTRSIERNRVGVLEAGGGRLWIGSGLVGTADGGRSFRAPSIDSLRFGSDRVSSLSVVGDTIWAGLSFTVETTQGFRDAASGLTVSRDGGRTWTLLPAPLDLPSDTAIVYGDPTRAPFPAVPFVAAVGAPPVGIHYDPPSQTLWLAAFRSGLRRSDDGGRTFQRVILPPDDLSSIAPDDPFLFPIVSPRSAQDTLGSFNFWAYDVLVDEAGDVWAATEAGLNVSRDGGVSWRRFGQTEGLSGDQVTTLAEQQVDGRRNPIWAATGPPARRQSTGQRGLTVTRDGGATFEVVLAGESVNAIAFDGSRILLAGESGLLVSDDDGRTFRAQQTFFDPARPTDPVSPDVRVLSVAVQGGFTWVGTDEGLFRTDDRTLQTWTRFRVDVPLVADLDDPRQISVETYAYPNPFSPASARQVRIRVGGDATRVRLFDFGMQLIRTLTPDQQAGDGLEALWDGRDEAGYRVPNGTYFYMVDGGGRGKILVIQ